ncbi:MAG: DNA-binding protein Alba [Candidatus Heimdallarchaeaceae archaeon]|nr:MAG: DNA-binding protein Alba [Candidatus Pacearchaeota archaeon]
MSEEQQDQQIIYIGRKGTMSYCLVVVTIFNKGADECILKARGRSISKAVDVAEISTRKFLAEQIKIDDIKIGSEEIETDTGAKTVSTIDITLRRS